MHDIRIEYGGADGSCKHICISGQEINLEDLLNALQKAQTESIKQVCIPKRQYESLIKSIIKTLEKLN